MFKLFRQIFGCALIVCASFFPQAHAGLTSTVIDFEGDLLTGLYFAGDPILHADFVMTPTIDFGTIDTVAGFFDPVAPTGNVTQFYFNSNDGGLLLARQDGGKFNLDGFSAAFVPQPTPLASQTIVVVAYALFENSVGGLFWSLGDTTTNALHYPFLNYSNSLDFSFFTDVLQVEFFACVLDSNVCGTASRNNAQFALDDIHVSTVPEPSTLALLSLGLLGLHLRNRRS